MDYITSRSCGGSPSQSANFASFQRFFSLFSSPFNFCHFNSEFNRKTTSLYSLHSMNRGGRKNAGVINAAQVINEYIIDRDLKKITNAINLLDRKFYESLYQAVEGESMDEKFQRLLVADEALGQKESLELFFASEQFDDIH
jgi:hypothetical protein